MSMQKKSIYVSENPVAVLDEVFSCAERLALCEAILRNRDHIKALPGSDFDFEIDLCNLIEEQLCFLADRLECIGSED